MLSFVGLARRAALLSSASAAAFGIAAPALASTDALSGETPGVTTSALGAPTLDLGALPSPQSAGVTGAADLPFDPVLEPEIVIANPGTSTTARDPRNITGIGQMVIDNGTGTIGLCTGTLINPRTVLFAAHCVNTRAATAYGAGSGGVPISFGFQADNLPAVQRWFLATIGGQPNAQRFQSNPALALYNVNQVRYNNLSLEPAAQRFLYGDVALASLDTPAANVPTWAMLFSPLAPTAVTAAGTGYNVQIVGYGSHGNATTGSASGSDFRRRIAENVLGALTDLRTFGNFLFGSSTSPTQNLYFIDFDDPRRGQSGASPFDFNAFRDNARGTNEGTTAAGDSGGPLILQNIFNLQVALGVLSGGYNRFFNGQPSDGYGTVSFYQPLYLYWDWIAENNPYRYVTNVAGDRRWGDPSHWVTTLDPNYQIIGPNGQLVNGVPTTPGEQKNGTSGQFGEICFESGGRSQCQNVGTGVFTDVRRPIGTDAVTDASDHSGQADASGISAAVQGSAGEAYAETLGGAAADAAAQALPAPTLANGLPGATNFVPNNQEPGRAAGTLGRYFDVTLNAAGTTTLDSAVTIDRFRITGANARLAVTSAGSLTSLIDVSQMTGSVLVDGRLTSRGDYLLMSGLLGGNGTVAAPFLTSVMGTIAPGGLGTLGTLTLQGNLVLASASQLVIDLGPNNQSDRLAVVAGSGQTGTANLGGTLIVNPLGRPVFGNTYTVLTAAGGRTGQFNAATANLSAILFPVIGYTANAVTVRIDARSFSSVIDRNSVIQQRFAALLDSNRVTNYGALSDLFGEIDVLSASGIQAAFEAMAPRTEATNRALGMMSTEAMSRFYRDRQEFVSSGEAGGTLALIGNPVQLASASFSGAGGRDMQTMSDMAAAQDMVRVRQTLPDNVSAYLAGGYLDGSSAPLVGAAGGRDDLSGWFAAAGMEVEASPGFRVGIGAHYADTDGDTAAPQSSDGKLVQGALYAVQDFDSGFTANGQLNIGLFSVDTQRTVPVGTTTYQLRGDNNAFAASAEIGVGQRIGMGALELTPKANVRYGLLDFGRSTETGGSAALTSRGYRYESLQGRVGADLGGDLAMGSTTVRPRLTAAYVREFLDPTDFVNIGFAVSGQTGPYVSFYLPATDRNWGEVGAGIRIGGERFSVDLSADTTIERQDLRYQSYRASLNVRF